ncbi:Nucleolar protein 16 [Marasmius sp. AFHP31]|nr:Nucleolar protein 16 [Marasmius sp. AFHP31]KAK1222516.1 Nucleolar protein 16 [Marasmius sp. AFHP31]
MSRFHRTSASLGFVFRAVELATTSCATLVVDFGFICYYVVALNTKFSEFMVLKDQHFGLLLNSSFDPSLSVDLNTTAAYAALGLVHDLNPSAAGGAEIIEVEQAAQTSNPSTTEAAMAFSASSSIEPHQNTSIPKGYGRIVRDEAGRVIRIELPDEEQNNEENLVEDVEVDMEQSAPDLEESVRERWVEGLGAQSGRPKTAAVKENVVGASRAAPSRYYTFTLFGPDQME